MTLEMFLVTLACFAGGIALSVWHTRRRYRAYVAERIAREVERELARRVMAQFSAQRQDASDAQERPSA